MFTLSSCSILPAVFAAGLLLTAAVPAFSQTPPTLSWGAGGAGGSGTWSTSVANWSDGSSTTVPWTDGDSAVFAGTAGTVSISGSVTAKQVTFSTPGYVVQNFFLEGSSSGLTVQTDADATISSSIFGDFTTSGFTKTGTGVLTLASTYPVFFNNVAVSAGELRFTGTGSPNGSTPYTLADTKGVALTFASTSNTIPSLAGGGTNGGVVRPNLTSGNINFSISSSTANASFGGSIQDNGSAVLAFQKSGASTQTLTGTNTYSGVTTVSGGTLTLGGAGGSLSKTASVAIFTGGTLLLDNSGVVSNTRLATDVPVNLSGGILALNGNASSAIAQTAGALSIARASTVTVSNPGAATTALAFAGGLTRQNNGTVNFGGNGNISVAGLANTNSIIGGYATVGSDWASVNAQGNITAYTGYSSDLTTATSQENLRVVNTQASPMTLSKSLTRNSVNLVNNDTSGAKLDVGVGQTLTVTGGGLLTSGGSGQSIQNGTLTTTGSELIITNQAALTVSSTVANTAAAVTLTKSGAGTLALTGTNTYTGSTVINQGTVSVATDVNLGAGSVVNVAGGTLQAAGSFTSVKSLQGGAGTVDTAGYNVSFTGGNNTGSFTKAGAGMLLLTGSVSSATLLAGTLNLSNLATGNAASLTLLGGRLEASGGGVQRVTSFGSPAEISPGAIGQAASLTLGTLLVFSTGVVDFDLGSNASDALTVSSFLSVSNTSGLLFRFGNLGGTKTGTAYPLLTLPSFGGGASASQFGIDAASTAAGYQGTFAVNGNMVSVTFTAVPEPGVCTLLLFGAGGVIYGLRGARKGRCC